MSKATESKSSSVVALLKKAHSAMSIVKKDFPLKEMFSSKVTVVNISILGLASKLVPKYEKEDNRGYHTTIYLADGQVTGCFSGALLEFAEFFYKAAGMNLDNGFCQLNFDLPLDVQVSLVPLDGGRTTYNFEIMGGEMSHVEKIGAGSYDKGLLQIDGKVENTEE